MAWYNNTLSRRLTTTVRMLLNYMALKVSSIEHASSMGSAVREEGGQQASSLVAKQAVEFPQVLALFGQGKERALR